MMDRMTSFLLLVTAILLLSFFFSSDDVVGDVVEAMIGSIVICGRVLSHIMYSNCVNLSTLR